MSEPEIARASVSVLVDLPTTSGVEIVRANTSAVLNPTFPTGVNVFRVGASVLAGLNTGEGVEVNRIRTSVLLGAPFVAPVDPAEADIVATEVTGQTIIGLAQSADLTLSETQAEVIVGLAQRAELTVSDLNAEVVVGLAQRANLMVAEVNAEVIVAISPVAYGLPDTNIFVAASAQFDNFCNDLRDYETYEADLDDREHALYLQSIANDLIASRANNEAEKAVAFQQVKTKLDCPQLMAGAPRQLETTEGFIDFHSAYRLIGIPRNGELIEFRLNHIRPEDEDTEDEPYRLVAVDNTVVELRVPYGISSFRTITHREARAWDLIPENNNQLSSAFIHGIWFREAGFIYVLNDATEIQRNYPTIAQDDPSDIIEATPLGLGLFLDAVVGQSRYRAGNVASGALLTQAVHLDPLYKVFSVRFASEVFALDNVMLIQYDGGEYLYDFEDVVTPVRRFSVIDDNSTLHYFRVTKRATLLTRGRMELVRIGAFDDHEDATLPAPTGVGLVPSTEQMQLSITLREPMPHPIQHGDQYIIVEGCDKTWDTCRLRFNNFQRFGGQPYLPGEDRLGQTVGIRRTIVV